MSSSVHRHWDSGALLPSHLNLQIQKAHNQRQNAEIRNNFNECILNCFHPHLLKFCTFDMRLTLSHVSSRLFFILSKKEAWDDLLDQIHDRVADIDLDLRDALDKQETLPRVMMRRAHSYVQKKHISDLLALRKPDYQLKLLLRVLRSLLFDAKFEKWNSYLKDTRMRNRDEVYHQLSMFDEEKISAYNRRVVKKFAPQLDLNTMRRKSASCGEVVEWLKAVYEYIISKQKIGAYEPERLYNQKLKLCRRLALIQKKLKYQWSFRDGPNDVPSQHTGEEVGELDAYNDDQETSSQVEEGNGESEYEVLTVPSQ